MIGTDIIEISRVARAMERSPRFLAKNFSPDELAYFQSRRMAANVVAGNFAAKEAFAKAAGTGIRGFSLIDVEILRDGLGKPYVRFRGEVSPVSVSISHSREYAVATVAGDTAIYDLSGLPLARMWNLLPKREKTANKGDCGRIFIVAGSVGMTGAACLCANAALRAGAGLVTVGTPASAQPVVAAKLTEAMTLPLPEKDGVLSGEAAEMILGAAAKSDVCVFGCGLGQSPGILKILRALLCEPGAPVLVDADGINALAKNINVLRDRKCEAVLTPHPGEMARLTGRSIEEIQKKRRAVAAEFAKKYGVTLLLKGHGTVVAGAGGEIYVNQTGNPGMATGGMGDVLSGILGALMGQGLTPYDAAALGAFLHGLAADIAARDVGELSLIAGDVAEYLPRAIIMLNHA